MRARSLPYTIPGQWVTCLTIVSLIIAPFGCDTAQLLSGLFPDTGGSSGSNTNPYGLLINTDTSSNILGGVRLRDGRSVLVYGTFNSDGSIREVTGAAIRDASGQEAGISFENGRPKKGWAFDGSMIEFAYDEVSADRLKGSVKIYFADADTTETIPFDVDLLAAAAELEKIASELGGITISEKDPPSEKTIQTAKAALGSDGLDKTDRNQLAIILIPMFAAVYAVVGYVMVWVMVQVMQAVMTAVVASVVAVTAAMVVAVFSPFIIMGEVLRLAAEQPVVQIGFGELEPGVIFRAELNW